MNYERMAAMIQSHLELGGTVDARMLKMMVQDESWTFESHFHHWSVAAIERNMAGGIYAAVQSCGCGELRRAVLPPEKFDEEPDA